MEAYWNLVTAQLEEYWPAFLKAVLTLFFGWFIARILRSVARRVMLKAKIETTLVGFVANLSYAVLMTLVVVSTVQALGVETNSFVAVLGAAGLAVGFALQGSLANFAAGVMVIVFRPFRAGDFVDAGGISGTVEEVQIFATILKTPDNKRVIVPNSSITGGTITNYSANDTRRVDMVFGIGYGDNIKKAKEVLEKIIAKDGRVLKAPAATVAVSELADNSVNIVCRPWVKTADYWAVLYDITETVKNRFEAEKISIPFPQRDVHLHQVA